MYVVVSLTTQEFDLLNGLAAIRPSEEAAWKRARELAEAALAACHDNEAEIREMVTHHDVLEIFVDGDDGYICGWTVIEVKDC